jgi:hypothetical protein
MLLDLKIKVRRALFVHSGELLTAGNGASPRLPLFPAGSSFSLSHPFTAVGFEIYGQD